jgi:hypothetical protein
MPMRVIPFRFLLCSGGVLGRPFANSVKYFLSTVPFTGIPLCTCTRYVVPYFFHPVGVNSQVAMLSSGEPGPRGPGLGCRV